MKDFEDGNDFVIEPDRPTVRHVSISAAFVAASFYFAFAVAQKPVERLSYFAFGVVAAALPFLFGLRRICIGGERILVDYGLFKRVMRYADMTNVEHYYVGGGGEGYSGFVVRMTSRTGNPMTIGDDRIDDPFELYSVIHRRWTAWKNVKTSTSAAAIPDT